MKTPSSIYKTEEARKSLMALYERKLQDLDIEYEEFDVETYAGKTHVIAAGKTDGPPVVLFHGINAGTPLTLEAVQGLADEFRIYGIDTVGQATKSSENRLPIEDDSFGKWAAEVLDRIDLPKASFIGVSYGAFILQKLMTHRPERIEKAIFVVPGGLVNGSFFVSTLKLTLPLMRFMISKRDEHLLKFMDAFYDTKDDFALTMQKNTLLGVRMDFRRPTLLTQTDVENLEAPVYAIVSDNDVFFPGEEALKKCKALFKNFAGSHVLKNCKHMPEKSHYPEMENKLREWLRQK